MSTKTISSRTIISDYRESASIIIQENDQISAVSFEDTNTKLFFFTRFEFKKEAVSMVLADIFKTTLN